MENQMKNLIAVMAVFVAIVTSCIAIASTVEVGNNGEARISSDVIWRNTSICVNDDVLAYGDVWKRAFVSPGSIIPVKTHNVSTRNGFFYSKMNTVADIGVIYDAGRIYLVRNITTESKVIFNPFMIFWLLSVFVMSIAVLSVSKIPGVAAATFAAAAFVAFVADATTTFATAVTFAAATFATATFAFVVATTAPIATNDKAFRFFVGMYYLCMAVSLIFFLF